MESIDTMKIDTTAFSVAAGFNAKIKNEYWRSRTPEERINAVEIMREINYGSSYSRSIQRFFEIAR
jgi:hypothetical protein